MLSVRPRVGAEAGVHRPPLTEPGGVGTVGFSSGQSCPGGAAEWEVVSLPRLEASRGGVLPLGSCKGSAWLQDNTRDGGSRGEGSRQCGACPIQPVCPPVWS